MAGDWIKALRIVDGDRYEVNTGGSKWKPGQEKRAGPFQYVRSKVNGLQVGAGFRMLLEVAGTAHAATCFGVFHKLLEIGADQPVETRWLILRVRGIPRNSEEVPGTPRNLAALTCFSIKHVTKALEVLTDPRVAWVEWGEVELGTGHSRKFLGTPRNSEVLSDIAESDTESDTESESDVGAPEKSGGVARDEPWGLSDWCHWWNGLHGEGLVPASVCTDPPDEAVQAGWKRVGQSKPLRILLADPAKIEARIRESQFVRGGWFRLEKLLGGKNKSRQFILQILLDGGYADHDPKQTNARPDPSQHYDPDRPVTAI